MTDDNTTRDSSDPSIDSESANGSDSDLSTAGSLGRRGFMQGAAASLAGAGGMAALSGRGEARGRGGWRLIVVGRGEGEHSYEIEMRHPHDYIWKTDYAGGNDSVECCDGTSVVNGEVQDWNADSYEFAGKIHRIEGDGTLSFHFLDEGFDYDDRIVVGGEGGRGTHYSIGVADGGIDPIEETTKSGQDSDELSSSSERSSTVDLVEGRVWNTGTDTYEVGLDESVQYVLIDGGHASVAPYRHDYTPNQGTRGEAAIVYFYMGDGPYTTFFQNFINLSEALRGYDRTILLKHDNQSNPVGWLTHRLADTVREPTRDNFERSVRELAEDELTIDMYITSHGDRSSFKMSTGTHGSEDWYDIGDIQRLRSQFVGGVPLRMVYQCNCWGSNLNDAWIELGADAAAGSRFVNFFPNQLPNFAREWRQGHSFHEALRRANTANSRAGVKQFLSGDQTVTSGDQWGPWTCTDLAVFRNNGSCAKNYFTDRWGHTDAEWHSTSANGWGFVKYTSEKIADGDLSIRR